MTKVNCDLLIEDKDIAEKINKYFNEGFHTGNIYCPYNVWDNGVNLELFSCIDAEIGVVEIEINSVKEIKDVN